MFDFYKHKVIISAFTVIFLILTSTSVSGQTGSCSKNGVIRDNQGVAATQKIPAYWLEPESVQAKSGSGWSPVGPFGGDVLDIAIYAQNPDIVIAAAGIPFISYDGGETWEFLESLSSAAQGKKINAVESLPDGTIIAGGVFISGKAYKSTDGGVSWQQFYYSSAGGVYDITYAPSNPDLIYMAVSGTYSTTTNRLIIKSTDGGETWTYFNMIGVLPVGASAVSVAIDPDNTETVFFAAQSGISDGYIVASFDGGENWEDKTSNLPGSKPFNVVTIANQTVYVGGGQLFGGNVLGVYKSSDNGLSWQSMSGNFPNKVANDILINPDDNNKIFVATEGDGVYYTTDGGINWTFNTSGAGDNGSVRSLIFAPGNTDKLYAGLLSLGICTSDNAGAGWSYSNHGIAALLINDIEVDENTPETILASFEAENSGGCYLSNNGGETWEPVEELPATRFSVVSIGPGGTLYAWSNGPSTVAPEGLYKSDDNGQTWQNMGPDLGTYFETEIFSISTSTTDTGLILIGGNNFGVAGWESVIYKTTDGGENWTKVMQGAEYDSFRYLFIAPASSDQIIYTAFGSTNQNKGGFMKSTDGGDNWNDISNGIPETTKWASAIVSDPVNTDILYGGAGGYGSTNGSVYKSIDSGNSWEVTGLSFSSWSRITDIYVSELDQNVVYAASNDHGIYLTKTGGEEWFEGNEGLPASNITSFSKSFIDDDTLRILTSTYTNSAFKSNVYVPGTTSYIDNTSNSFEVLIYPNPAKEFCTVKLNLTTPGKVKITVLNSIGKAIQNLENGHFDSGKYDYYFSEKPGIYFIKTEVNGTIIIRKVILL